MSSLQNHERVHAEYNDQTNQSIGLIKDVHLESTSSMHGDSTIYLKAFRDDLSSILPAGDATEPSEEAEEPTDLSMARSSRENVAMVAEEIEPGEIRRNHGQPGEVRENIHC